MPRRRGPVAGFRGPEELEGGQEERRRLNRDYMRRWRSDPRHRARERERSRFYSRERKGRAAGNCCGPPYTNARGELVCGFCLWRPAVEHVTRLRISESGPDEYVEVLIPYCGDC
jgi:hypothetical protein